MHHLGILDGQMYVMDEDGCVCDAHALTGYRRAKCQVQQRTNLYAVDVAAAYRQLADFFSQQG